MRMRATVILGLVATTVAMIVVGGAGPVAAKGPTGATVTWPSGQEAEIEPTDVEHMGFGSLIEDVAMWSMLDPGSGAPDLAPAPPDGLAEDQLGPRYTITWTMYDASEGFELYQHLYPEAPGGAVVYSPDGLPAEPYSPVTTGGWLRSPGDPVATLASLGVDLNAPAPAPGTGPDPAPASRATPAARTATANEGEGAGLPVGAVAGLVIVALAGAGAAVGLRLRGRRAAPAAG
jgi:hypothetical protein